MVLLSFSEGILLVFVSPQDDWNLVYILSFKEGTNLRSIYLSPNLSISLRIRVARLISGLEEVLEEKCIF